jgi:4,5-DOPA dioxygenase extradiol
MLPVLFLSHGSPLQALEPSAAGAAWRELAASLPRPRAIVMVSAHWESSLPMVSSNSRSATVHDFGGFPASLYSLRYAAPPAAEPAARVAALLRAATIPASIDGCRGLDHGAWVPLRWMYPEADIPVVQLSVQPSQGTAKHLELGSALASLPSDDVLVIGSGHVTHNLGDAFRRAATPAPHAYASEFATWLHDRLLAADVAALLDYRARAPHATRAHPTEEHLLPLFVALGTAGTAARATRCFSGMEANVLVMDAYRFDVNASRT